MTDKWDAIVIGGGHAGVEASLSLARVGLSTLLVTQNLDTIGRLSCNPAVGGLSKGNIVREIDALGGEMAKLIDSSMIQYRILNRRRGPAVQSPRAQADRFLYEALAKKSIESCQGLSLFQDTVTEIVTQGERCIGVRTERGNFIRSTATIITTGTFMNGKIFAGSYTALWGRLNEPSALGLSENLTENGYSLSQLKTGTSARILKDSIDFDLLTPQEGDATIRPFSFAYEAVDRPSVPCHITYTNRETHKIISDNMDKSPLLGGEIKGTGPRYCPSIEDKVIRFQERDRHQIFLEPEGLESCEYYLNGLSSSLPEEVQRAFIRTIPGLEKAHITRTGYAVEYDFINPTQLYPTLESKLHKNLFFAGQTNGTSGYEEAACQGLVAGINAAANITGNKPLTIGRHEGYIGVLIDDLVTKGTEEPYRMFTSRAEYRLSLRHDNADSRLFEKGVAAGLHSQQAIDHFNRKRESIEKIKCFLESEKASEEVLAALAPEGVAPGASLSHLLKIPDINPLELKAFYRGLKEYPLEWVEQAELDIKYSGYIKRQEYQINRLKKIEKIVIPEGFDYSRIVGLSSESKEKLGRVKPVSVGQASRISGIRNSDIALLMVTLEKQHGKQSKNAP